MDLKWFGLSLVSTISKDHFLDYYQDLAKKQWLKKEQLEQLQLHKLKRLLSHSIQNVPFYQRRFTGFDPSSIKNLNDIKNLPILTKEELKKGGAEAIAKNQKRLLAKTTSGTTGPPFTFMISRNFFSLEIARNLRIFDLPGFTLGEPWVLFTPLRGKKSFLFSFLTNRLVLDANQITIKRTPPCCPSAINNRLEPDEDMIRHFCKRIQKHKPKAIYSYPSALIALATFIRKWSIKEINIRIIISSGEVLTSGIRTYLEETFKGEVFNLYGTTEFPAVAEECKEHNGLHIFADSYLVEFINQGKL